MFQKLRQSVFSILQLADCLQQPAKFFPAIRYDQICTICVSSAKIITLWLVTEYQTVVSKHNIYWILYIDDSWLPRTETTILYCWT